MSQYKFVDSRLEDDIKLNIVPSIFPSLNYTHSKLLTKCLIRLINVIALCFGFDGDDYFNQLRQNNYQDVKWLLIHLLPYINDANSLSDIEMLDDIYDAKLGGDVNKSEVKYVYSNLQYNRCIRGDTYKERPFNKVYLEHNLYLLMNTVKTMAHKMLVNWMDIIPYDMATYDRTKLFKLTQECFNENKLTDWDPVVDCSLDLTDEVVCETLGKKINGLPMDDIYNVLSIDLYHSIKNIKWLIYDMPVESFGTLPLIITLKIFFNTKLMIDGTGTEWNKLSDANANGFSATWSEIVKTCNNGNGATIYSKLSLSGATMRKMIKAIIVAFDYGYKNMNTENGAVKHGYIRIGTDDDVDLYDEEDDSGGYAEIRAAVNSVDPQHIYEFMRSCLQQFKGTWFGLKMMNEEKTDILDIEIKKTLDTREYNLGKRSKKYYKNFVIFEHDGKTMQISHKNIYNYAKSLVHYVEGDEWLEYPKLWTSLTPDAKNEILKRLNNQYSDPIEWFNIGRYIEMLDLKGRSKFTGSTRDFNNILHEEIRKKIIEVIFETMVSKGILTQFIPNRKITDENYTSKDDVAKKLAKLRFNTSESNTVWTSAYHYMTGLRYMNMKPFIFNNTEHTIFSYNSLIPWYTASALDWVAQIGFCHHFINNRISFITGATGVGKSTQVPNLFLYYLKAVDYNNMGKVVCSQPRITPTTQNADIVSQWFGVPIRYSVGADIEYTDNYYVQMEHSKKPHIKDTEAPMLKYITDGALVLTIDGPLLKNKKPNGQWMDRNMYDVIMIDEAHEHNKSMDMLLTLLRLPATYNNSLRIVILSATMDEDEPRYRRYFRNINDNRKYPLNQWIATTKLDRINVDRRYHISAPGKTTRYVVEDIYVPNQDEKTTIMDIIQKSTDGDILVFQAGQGDINKLIADINPSLPSNVIAVPYHSQLSDMHREFVEKIAEKKQYLKISKDVAFAEQPILTEGTGSYDRVVIVATNVAEASITIPTLKFVVDTGTQKVDVYDYKKRSNILKKMDISQSSLMQRRGRVGRKSSGTVFHLYEEGKMLNNKTSYQISIHNIALDMYRKIRNSSIEPMFVLSTKDPNNPFTNVTHGDVSKKSALFTNDIAMFLATHYFAEREYYSYYGNDEHYDYKNYALPVPYYQTGYSIETLVDNFGTLYLIHPDELVLERNIGGEIIKSLADNDSVICVDKQIVSQKTISFCRILYDYMYLAIKDGNVDRTLLGINIMSLMDKLQIEEHSMLRTVIFGMALGCGNEILQIIALYKAIQYSVKNLTIIDDKKRYQLNKMNDFMSDAHSDTDKLLDFLNNFAQLTKTLNINMDMTNTKYINATKDGNAKYNLTADEYAYLLDPMNNEKKMTKRLNKDDKSTIKQFQKDLSNTFMKEFSANLDRIQEWCTNRYINIDTVAKFIKELSNLKIELSKSMTSDVLKFIGSLSAIFKTSPIDYKTSNIINIALLFGFPFNVCKKIHGSSHYVSIYTPALDNVYTIGSMAKARYIPNTLVRPLYLENYVLYLNVDVETNTILGLHHITPAEISIINHVYRPSVFSEYELHKKEISQYVDKIMGSHDIEPSMIGKLAQLITTIGEAVNEAKIDVTQSYDSDMSKLNKNIIRLKLV